MLIFEGFMNILAVNGSPKGENSVTLQTIYYLEKLFPDHNFEVFTDPCAILTDPESGRTMAVSTDCPGVQFYCGNFLGGEMGKDGVCYPKRSGVCLETQYYPDSMNHPEWPQPITKAGEHYHSVTRFIFI